MIDLNELLHLAPRLKTSLADFLYALAASDSEQSARINDYFGKEETEGELRTDDATLAEVKDKIEAIIQTRQEPQAEEQAAPAEVVAHSEPAALPPPPLTAGLPKRDSAGLPWDGRIHSSSKAILQDGTWRQKRGVDEAVLASVTAELKLAQLAGAVSPPPAPILAIVPPPPFVASAVPPAPPVSITPAPESAGAAPTASPSSGPITFPQLMRKITDGIISKAIDQSHVTAACATVGLPSIISLKDRPDLVEAVAAALGVAP